MGDKTKMRMKERLLELEVLQEQGKITENVDITNLDEVLKIIGGKRK